MELEDVKALRDGDIITVFYPNDNPNEPNEFKHRRVLLYDKYSNFYCRVICITDIDNITDQVGISVHKGSKEGNLMGLTKDSFINIHDCKSIPTTAIDELIGICPQEIFDKIVELKPLF